MGSAAHPDPHPRRQPPYPVHNGLVATAYVPLLDVAASVAPQLLVALARARIAASLGGVPGAGVPGAGVPGAGVPGADGDGAAGADRTAASDGSGTAPTLDEAPRTLRLYVAAAERADARTIVAAVLRGGATAGTADGAATPGPLARPVPDTDGYDAIDVDAAFADLVADWHVDTVAAVREAERALYAEDEQWRAKLNPGETDPLWLDEQHYVPPAPPPLPRLSGPTVGACVLIACSALLFIFGADLGLDAGFTMMLGVGGVLIATGLLIMRLRVRSDDDDDGAIV